MKSLKVCPLCKHPLGNFGKREIKGIVKIIKRVSGKYCKVVNNPKMCEFHDKRFCQLFPHTYLDHDGIGALPCKQCDDLLERYTKVED